MLTTEAAGLAIQIAKGLIKLTRRVDLVLAEKEVVEAPMALPAPNLGLMPGKRLMKTELTKLVRAPKGDPDSLGSDRALIEAELAKGAGSDKNRLFSFVEQYLPALAYQSQLDLNGSFVIALKAARPEWATDPELCVAAFYVSSGAKLHKKSYSWRIALTVVDVLSEFGGENTALFIRDERLQGVVGAVLKRFGDVDLQQIDSTSVLLQTVLRATLNGVLDSKDKLRVNNEWLEAVFDALAKAREAMPEEDSDEFLLGLVQGEGYPALLGALLESAAGHINDDELTNFRDVAADFLNEVAGLVKGKASIKGFFEDHWGDLVRAGLHAAEKNSVALLGNKKLLGTILAQVAGDLAKFPDNRLLSTDSLYGIVNSIAAVAVENPELIEELLESDEKWVAKLIGSVAGTVADKDIREVFTTEGVETLFIDTFETFSKHPELIVGDSKLAGALVGGVLKELAAVKSFAAGDLATAAVGGALSGLSANPGLIKFKYSEVVSSLAGKVAMLVKDHTLTGVQGQDILRAATASLAENPQLFLDLELKLVEGVLTAVTSASKGRPEGLITGITLIQVVNEVTHTLARTGRAAMTNHPAADFVNQLEQLISAGLTRADAELGRRIGLSALPGAMGELVAAWAQGKVAQLDPDNENFKKLFSEFAEKAAA